MSDLKNKNKKQKNKKTKHVKPAVTECLFNIIISSAWKLEIVKMSSLKSPPPQPPTCAFDFFSIKFFIMVMITIYMFLSFIIQITSSEQWPSLKVAWSIRFTTS